MVLKEEFIQELTDINSRFVNDINTKLSNLDKKFNGFLSKYNKVDSELQQCKNVNSHLRIIQHQCIKVRQPTALPFLHSSALFLYTFFGIFHFCQFFHVAPFVVLLHVAVTSCCTFFVLH